MFVGYPKGTRGSLFYSSQDKKVLVSTNAIFLEEDYMKDFKPRSKIILDELSGNSNIVPDRVNELIPNSDHYNQPEPVAEQRPPVLYHSGRIIRRPTR